MFHSLLTALVLLVGTTTPTVAPDVKACYNRDDIAKVFNYAKGDKIYVWHMGRNGSKVYDQYYDTKSKLFFCIPEDIKGCLHPESTIVVTQYHYSYFTETPYA